MKLGRSNTMFSWYLDAVLSEGDALLYSWKIYQQKRRDRVYLSVYIAVYLSVILNIYHFENLSVCLSIYLSIYLDDFSQFWWIWDKPQSSKTMVSCKERQKEDADKLMKQISFVWKMHTADALNQSDLHCIQSIHLIIFMGIQPITVMILDY